MITKDFEKYFPLPWKMHRFGEGDNIITASGEPLCYIKCGKTEQNRNACQYLVQCANLMPEIERALKLYFDRRIYVQSPVTENDLKKLYNEIADITGGEKIETTI